MINNVLITKGIWITWQVDKKFCSKNRLGALLLNTIHQRCHLLHNNDFSTRHFSCHASTSCEPFLFFLKMSPLGYGKISTLWTALNRFGSDVHPLGEHLVLASAFNHEPITTVWFLFDQSKRLKHADFLCRDHDQIWRHLKVTRRSNLRCIAKILSFGYE